MQIRLAYYLFVQLMKVSKELFVPDNLGPASLFGIMNDGNAYSQRYLNGFQHSYFHSSLYLFFDSSVMMDTWYWK